MFTTLSQVISVAVIAFYLQVVVVLAAPYESTIVRRDDTTPVDGAFDGQVSWVDMTSGDGHTSGKDTDGIPYLEYLINHYINTVAKEDRISVFWTGGKMEEDDYDDIYEFIETKSGLSYHGKIFGDVFDNSYFEKEMGVSSSNKNNLWWRAIYRSSKALAAGATNGKAYVYLKPDNCRTIFSSPSKDPLDDDPEHGGEATVGEVWHYAELPMLMRNTNINQIVSFYKKDRKFVTNVEWDASADAAVYPRDYIEDTALDAVPINLPAAADRSPMKRSHVADV